MPPALCGYQGKSLFLDPDMLMLGDVCELFDLMDGDHSVYVVKGKQRFEWSSLMLFNNEKCQELTPKYIDDANNHPQSLDWAESVGELPPEWNFCVGYDEVRETPKLVHYTAGIPHFAETRACDFSAEWFEEYEAMIGNCSWLELMGDSVHAEMVLDNLKARQTEWRNRH
jgi:lipopolysaccharide biosynthesis glycosyltransferase